jgi:hypothetical protein
MTSLLLKRASATSGEWGDDYDVLADDAKAALVGSPWMWTLAFGHHKDRSPTHG